VISCHGCHRNRARLPHRAYDSNTGDEREGRDEVDRRPEADEVRDGTGEQSADRVAEVSPEAIDAQGATLEPDATPGRHRGTISFPDRGDRQVTVSWDGPAGKGSAKFTVPVR
jgi:hypothetical protein